MEYEGLPIELTILHATYFSAMLISLSTSLYFFANKALDRRHKFHALLMFEISLVDE